MRIRLASLVVTLALLVSSAPAGAQDGNPFDQQLPPPQPTPAPTVEPVQDPNEGFGRETLWIIGAALLVAFVGIGVWISRDARRALPPGERDDPRSPRDQGPHRHERQAKAKARAKGRAQRRARKAARRTRR
jgi:hypothetical protein